jgi:hypothetical protein
MNIAPIQDVSFDDDATFAMGVGFDQACNSLRALAHDDKMRELVAKRIIEAATNGVRDPVRFHSLALVTFSVDDVSMRVASAGRTAPALSTLRLRAQRDQESQAGSPLAGLIAL